MAGFKTSVPLSNNKRPMKRNSVEKQKKLLKKANLSLKWVRPPS